MSQSIRNRRATPPSAHFHRNPLGRSSAAADFSVRRPPDSLDPYHQDMGLRSRLEKQPTDFRQSTSYFGDGTLVLASARFHTERDPTHEAAKRLQQFRLQNGLAQVVATHLPAMHRQISLFILIFMIG